MGALYHTDGRFVHRFCLVYNKGMSGRVRLTTDQKMAALAMIARGDTLSQVAGHLMNDFSVSITESALSKIKQAHAETIAKMQTTIADGKAAEAEDMLKRGRRHLNRKLDKAERDEQALEELDQKYRNKEIKSIEEYRRRKAGLIKVSIAELIDLTRAMHTQMIKSPQFPELPPGSPQANLSPGNHATPAQLEALLQAIQAGNTVEIQRLIFNPGVPNETAHNIPA